MKQLVLDIRTGELGLREVAAPLVGSGEVLIANQRSLISAGTEKTARELAKKSLLGKARERPDQVRRVLEKLRSDGWFEAVRQVREKLDDPMGLGYSSAGVVLACGDTIQDLKPGDLVASNGPHAEMVVVPRNLIAAVPFGVSAEEASFTVLGAIALQGIRLAQVSLGERVLVIGLGLVGQLTVAILHAAGCVVFGTEPDLAKCELARRMGAAMAGGGLTASQLGDLTEGVGADAVIITASTESNGPITLAAEAVRRRGRVILVGVVGLKLDRRPFYFKEAQFTVSCSYGPGRYDPSYEEQGHDYPLAYVRWTENRNMQAVLQLMATGQLDVTPLISHRFPLERVEEAYELLEKGTEPHLGIVLEYPAAPQQVERRPLVWNRPAPQPGTIGIGVLGAGNFARMMLLPRIAAHPNARLVALCSAKGLHAAHAGEKFQFQRAVATEEDIFDSPDVDAVFSITQHHWHAAHVICAIKAGKHCFVEKPLALTLEEIDAIESAIREAGPHCPVIMVGFNRRFSEAAELARAPFHDIIAPLTVSIRMNAGAIPAEHWTQQNSVGGGRIIGEACHAMDLAGWLTRSPPVRVYAESIGGPCATAVTDDQCFITLRHANGSVSNIAYLAGGDRACPKERIEVFGGGRTAIIDDFRRVTTYVEGRSRTRRLGGDKGHAAEIAAFLDNIRAGGPPPIPWSDLRSVSVAAILAVRSLREGSPFEIPAP